MGLSLGLLADWLCIARPRCLAALKAGILKRRPFLFHHPVHVLRSVVDGTYGNLVHQTSPSDNGATFSPEKGQSENRDKELLHPQNAESEWENFPSQPQRRFAALLTQKWT